MERADIARMLAAANDFRSRRDWKQAIDTLCRVLAIDPDHARPHASLALALAGARRLPGAAIEVGLALAADGNDGYCHYAAAFVLRAQRKLDEAWQHCLVALEQESDVGALVLGAQIQLLRGEPDEARDLADRALEKSPEHPSALRTVARVALDAYDLDDAADAIARALRVSPEAIETHVLAGQIALARGEADDADHHLQVALRADPTHPDVLALLASCKARKSRLLGAWWRWHSWAAARSEGRRVAILLGSFVIARLAMILAGALGDERLEDVVYYAWMAMCAYTWIAPVMLRRMIARELQTVKLRDDY